MPVWELEVRVRCLRRPVHSGRGGGAVPDPVQLLCRLIAGLPARTFTVTRLDAPGLLGSINQISDAAGVRLRLRARAGEGGRETARRVARRLRAARAGEAQVRVRMTSKPEAP